MLLAPRCKLLFIGDSVTDAGRDASGEETPWAAGFGRGYVSLVNAWLLATRPEAPVRIVNKGVSGHTIRDLKGRWQTDVLDHRPDWLAVMIGINDVWRQFDVPMQHEKQVQPDEYAAILEELVARTRPTLSGGLVLATPFFIENNRQDAMRARMDEYGAIVKAAAARHGARFVDTQAAFDVLLAHTHSSSIAWDRIHPNQVGHMALARAFLRAFEAL